MPEAARELRVSELTVRRWVRSGRLTARKLPGPTGRYLVTRSALDALLGEEVR